MMVRLYSLLVLCAWLAGCAGPGEPLPRTTEAYIWQRAWGSNVARSAAQFAPRVDGYRVLIAETRWEGSVVADTAAVDWHALSASGVPVTAVVRMDVSYAATFDDGNGAAAAEQLRRLVADCREHAAGANVTWAGIELDYDAPTRALAAYADFLADFRTPGEPLSITALPDWLRSDAWPRCAKMCDSYTLQVHSLQPPESIDTIRPLCDVGAAVAAAQRADTIGVPFRVALPTFAYELHFDDAGHFTGIRAEQRVASNRDRTRIVTSEPGAMIAFRDRLGAAHFAHYLGVTWFRLPVEGDELNWDSRTFAAVLEGEAIPSEVIVQIEQVEPGLADIWIVPAAASKIPGEIEISLVSEGTPPEFYDAMAAYRIGRRESGFTLTGPAYKERTRVGWFRWPAGNEGSLCVARVER